MNVQYMNVPYLDFYLTVGKMRVYKSQRLTHGIKRSEDDYFIFMRGVMDSLNQLSLEYNAVGMQLAKLPARQQPVCVGFEEGVFCRCVGMEFQAADASGYERR